MQMDRPLRIVTPTVDGDVLAVFARADTEFTPPQVHAVIGEHSVAGVRKVMQRLAGQGILLHRRAGNAVVYRLNRDHLSAPAIVALATIKDTFIGRLSDTFASWSLPARYAALFGSAATGAMTPASDIDIFVVRPDGPTDDRWWDQVVVLQRDVAAWTGNDCRVLEYAHTEVVAGLASGDRVLVGIVESGVRLAGSSRYFSDARRRSA